MTPAPLERTRPSDAERDRALAVLRDGAGSGRLSHDTFIRRMNFVLRAQTRAELSDALRDLPRAESRVVTWTRELRGRIPRLALARTAARPTAIGSWLASLPRVSVVRPLAAPPLPGLALPPPGSPTVRIGRGPGATLRLPDVSVSRCHAELRYVDDGWMVRDLGSMNGTQVNGLRITTPARVRPGDQIQFGAVAYVLTWTDQP
jgi:FHA domain/DUF1707 SHOCT-like domain